MSKPAHVQPKLPTIPTREGPEFESLPDRPAVNVFLEHVKQTGAPHTWAPLTTTKHPKGLAPRLVTRFQIPAKFRGEKELQAPCSICSVTHPKFESGYLVWSSDGRLRIIGHKCAKAYFEGDSFERAVSDLTDTEREANARQLLAEEMPLLGRKLMAAVTLGKRTVGLVGYHERLTVRVTRRAMNAARRSAEGNHLTHNKSTSGKDDKGNIIFARTPVATVRNVEALVVHWVFLRDLEAVIVAAGAHWIVERDEIDERLEAMNRLEVFAAAGAISRLSRIVERTEKLHKSLSAFLTDENLLELSKWGEDLAGNTPFWIRAPGDGRLYAYSGPKPRHLWNRQHYELERAPADAFLPVKINGDTLGDLHSGFRA